MSYLAIRLLDRPLGPFDHIKRALKRLVKKLTPTSKLNSERKVLARPIEKREIKKILDVMRRQTRLVVAVLSSEIL